MPCPRRDKRLRTLIKQRKEVQNLYVTFVTFFSQWENLIAFINDALCEVR